MRQIIAMGGGNTRSMLALWREWGLDAILRKAWLQGVVLAGISAGANCWFEWCSTDSFGNGSIRPWPALGLLADGFCPHYDSESARRPSLKAMVGAGEMPATYACDDGAAIHFVDGGPAGAVSSRPAARAYRVYCDPTGQVAETPVATRYLGV